MRLGLDFALARFLAASPEEDQARAVRTVRTVHLKGGVRLSYRLNKGDLHGIREVWLDECYRLPFENSSGALLDLGANIGLTSVWLARKYGFAPVIAVEPDPRNAALARRNLEQNAINGEVIEAAIGPREGAAHFEASGISNLGKVSTTGSPVRMTTVAAILEKSGCARFALVKMDIEGGEQELLAGPTDWLDRVDAIIAEFHPDRIDYPGAIRSIAARGLKYIPASSVFPHNMDSFVSRRP